MRFYLPHCAIEATRKATPRQIQLVPKAPPPRPSLFASRGTVSAKHGLGITVSVAVVSDAYGRVRVAAALALQGYVAEERFASGALPAQQ